jgi:hypothetical protein
MSDQNIGDELAQMFVDAAVRQFTGDEGVYFVAHDAKNGKAIDNVQPVMAEDTGELVGCWVRTLTYISADDIPGLGETVRAGK